MRQAYQENKQKRTIDISALQDFKVSTKQDWNNWSFRDQQFQNIPLGFTNRFNFYRNLRFSDPSLIQQTQQEANFIVVQENIKKKDKVYISKNAKMTENKIGYGWKRALNKKFQRNPRQYTNQIKTNFKKITVKNNWAEIKSITKNNLQNLPDVKNFKVHNFKTVGHLNYVNPDVQRISWEQTRFKQNKSYVVNPILTVKDKVLLKIAGKLLQQEQTQSQRVNIICNPTFLLALLTVRASVYPWNIEVQKVGNTILLESFKNSEDESQKLNYLDLFTVNQNTPNNMPVQESKLRETCITATKMTKVFHDLLASGEEVNQKQTAEHYLQNQQSSQQQQQQLGDQKEEQQKQELDKLRKYIKITVDNIDIYTYVQIDGAKKNTYTNQIDYFLIRTFVQSESQGVWVKDMKTPGLIINKQHPSNSSSIQKWLCQAHLAGVQKIKTGFMGFSQNKNLTLLNVSQVSTKSLQNTLSFKYENCWSSAKYILDILAKLDEGTYVLAKNPYTPLLIKLYLTKSAAEQEFQQEQNSEDINTKNA